MTISVPKCRRIYSLQSIWFCNGLVSFLLWTIDQKRFDVAVVRQTNLDYYGTNCFSAKNIYLFLVPGVGRNWSPIFVLQKIGPIKATIVHSLIRSFYLFLAFPPIKRPIVDIVPVNHVK